LIWFLEHLKINARGSEIMSDKELIIEKKLRQKMQAKGDKFKLSK
jgi:hypothetical protein